MRVKAFFTINTDLSMKYVEYKEDIRLQHET